MQKLSISAQIRSASAKPDHVRANKMTPAVIYGHKVAPQSLQLISGDLSKLVRAAGLTHIVEIDVEGKKSSVLIHDIQRHPVTGDLVHVDFFVVSQTEKLTVNIPVKLVGESLAVREGAQLEQPIHQIEVRLLPADLVDAIEVDISALKKSNDVIHISDIAAQFKKMEFLTPGTNVIVSAKNFDEKSLEEAETVVTAAANEEKAEAKAA
jgi:large subunit ribosomal protein L25